MTNDPMTTPATPGGDGAGDAGKAQASGDPVAQNGRASAGPGALRAAPIGIPEDHPEATCEDCGLGNVGWFAPSDVWNAVCRPPDYAADPMLCPMCFMRRAVAKGFSHSGWLVVPSNADWGPLDRADMLTTATAERQRLANMASEGDWDAVRELMNAAHADAIANPDDAVWSDRVVAAQHALLATLTARRAAAMEGGGAGLIATERRRQVDAEGWTAEHDDAHRNGEMARAAAVYAWGEVRPVFVKKAWPWSPEWFKPEFMYWRYHPALDRGERSVGDVDPFSGGVVEVSLIESRVRVLTKAGALIAAEIDRLTRALAAAPTATAGEG